MLAVARSFEDSSRRVLNHPYLSWIDFVVLESAWWRCFRSGGVRAGAGARVAAFVFDQRTPAGADYCRHRVGLRAAQRLGHLQAEETGIVDCIDGIPRQGTQLFRLVRIRLHDVADALDRFQEDSGQRGPLVVAGGVAANAYLRARLEAAAQESGAVMVAPPPRLCTDNAAMIAWAGVERLGAGLTDALDFAPRPRWPLEEVRGPKGASSAAHAEPRR
ncbi:MAG: hypothetical protein IH924_04840 [Proteobacteria bacterium]|nr:hypothetical protein [Pseudomonadota bacterium]